ncbi:NADH:flavin oxidoreductase/NADH oxidase [Cellulomonas timonensis]|uniref:NADH:flavin oxidoreductase/NADH oxidase n=1 Tax=Cellulomonas timonensis TaxID=1689271 RepID=UPI00082FC54E|nr:NADH:flavin oxidoreductase/NADH oxidase [Cellulomonas timonensis]
MTSLFAPLILRELQIPNRVWMSPMCTYSAEPTGPLTGAPTDFHLAHYTARAAGGVGLVMVEATGVRPEGRISPWDLGLWSDAQERELGRLAASIAAAGAVPAIQLAHAGRKASVNKPWLGDNALGLDEHGWTPVGPSPIAFPGLPVPHELTRDEIAEVVQAFAASARRALAAGFQAVEIHAAHGYLLHSFLSPLSNQRTDEYGGDLAGRARIVLETIDAVRAVWPDGLPVMLRVSTTDWVAEDPEDDRAAWTVEDTIELTRLATARGVDLIDASSGGLVRARIPHDRDYQTRHAGRIRRATGATVAAVGRIDDPAWATRLLEDGEADAVFLGRALLRDPSWANAAAVAVGGKPRYLEQYAYAV